MEAVGEEKEMDMEIAEVESGKSWEADFTLTLVLHLALGYVTQWAMYLKARAW